MKITYSQIKELKFIYSEHKNLSERISNAKKTYQDRNGAVLVKLNRAGKDIELDENTLWLEIFHGGVDTQAGKIMKVKYPDLFDLFKRHEETTTKLNIFTAKNWGFFFQEMSLVMLIDIVLALIKFQLNPANWFKK